MGARSDSNDGSRGESKFAETLVGVARIKDFVEMDSEAPWASNCTLNEPSFCAEISVMLAPVCREGPRMFESACMRVSLPSRKARSAGRSRGPDFVFAARHVPRMMLPADFSASWRDGKALRRLSRSGSPAYTPETKGPTRRSRSCGENFLRTKAATDSSASGGALFPSKSRMRAHLVGPLMSELMKNTGGLRGTGRSSPSIITYRGAWGGAWRTWSEMPRSAHS